MSAGFSLHPARLLLPLCCVAATLPPQQAMPATATNTPPAIADALARYRQAAANDPAEVLARYLRTLATDPRDLEALTGAGRAALTIGDANAALAFYARAEEIAPRDGRIKAGIAAALVQLEKPKEAIKLFDEATNLGVPESDVASDRGLAWDLRGDPKRAQKYYALALQARDDDETVRRLALSTAISGDGEAAAALLTPLLRRNDPAAWRARAFVHALGGNVAAAETVARSAMSSAQVAALRPFLVRLASLKPAQQALAVHFGEMPAEGRRYSPAELAALDGSTTRPGVPRSADALVPAGDAFGPPPERGNATRPAERLSIAPRRRPGERDTASVVASAPTKPLALTAAAAPASRAQPSPTPVPKPAPSPPSAVPAAPASPPSLAASPAKPRALAAAVVPPPTPPVPRPLPPPPRPVPSLPAVASAASTSPSTAATSVPSSRLAPSAPAVTSPRVAVAAAPASLPAGALPPTIVSPAPPPTRPLVFGPPAPPPAALVVEKAPAIISPTPVATVAANPAATPAIPDAAAPLAPVAFSLAPKPPRSTSLAAVETAIAASVQAERAALAARAAAPVESPPSVAKVAAGPQQRPEPAKKTEPEKKPEPEKKAKAEPDKAKPKLDDRKEAKPSTNAPERVWVQVAGGATKADLPKAWAKLKDKAPALAKGQGTATTPLRFTNRLLVGPFKNADAAQDYVNRMSRNGLSGFVFTSAKGQDVEKLPSGK